MADFRDYLSQRYGGESPIQQPSYQPGAGGYDFRSFLNYYDQVQQANQQLGWQQNMQDNEESAFSRGYQQDDKKYRQMTDLEKFSAGARQASDFIGNAAGNALFEFLNGRPVDPYRDDLSAIKPENIPYMAANIPGMFIGAIPDLAAYGSELIAGTPAQEGDLGTGLIEDRSLRPEEVGADIGYGALSAFSLIPGLGVEARGAGLAMKGVGKVAGQGSKFGKAFTAAGNTALKGEASGIGALERYGASLGKEGAQLNKYRWGDTALEAAGSGAFEALQEGGQTLMEDIRYDNLGENTPEDVLRGAFWGGMAGTAMGGGMSAAHTALRNHRAKNDGGATKSPGNSSTSFFQFWDPNTDSSNFSVTPEMQQHLLEAQGNQEGLDHIGSSMKGVAGRLGQNPNGIYYGTRGFRRQYERNRDNVEAMTELASDFGMSVEELDSVMELDDIQLANRLTQVVQEKWASGKPRDRMVLSTTRAPSTKYGSHQTFFVLGFTPGNTVSFGPGNATAFGGDLDGDNYSLFIDKSDGLNSWDHLPTRRLMTPKRVPAKGAGGSEYIKYGTPEFGFEEAGITDVIKDGEAKKIVLEAIDSVLEDHGIRNVDRMNQIKGDIINSFNVSQKEADAGITWKHKLAYSLEKIRDTENGFERTNGRTEEAYTVALAGDDLVADLISAISRESAPFESIRHSIEAYGLDNPENASPELKATMENIPESRGSMGDKVSLMQILNVFGKLNYELSSKESPMFRFKQMTAWNAKFREMVTGLVHELNLDRVSDVDANVKWTMQMINNLHLPIDYVNTAFQAKVAYDVMEKLGLNKANSTVKFGSGLQYDYVVSVVKDAWNSNADIFEKAAEGMYTTEGEKATELVFKTRVLNDEPNSFARVFADLFGDWDCSQLATIDSNSIANGMSLNGLVEMIASSPNNIDVSQFSYTEGFGQLIEAMVKDFEGRKNAQTQTVMQQIDSCKTLPESIMVGEDGVVTWAAEDDLKVGFWTNALQHLFGMKASRWLGILSSDFLSHSGWGRFLISRNPEEVKRGAIAAKIMYNWSPFLKIANDPSKNQMQIEAALSTIDLDNPLNKWILYRMYADGYKKTGEKGVISLDPLAEITNPEKGTYELWSERFDNNGIVHVRKGSDMLFYYAMADNETSITGSDLSTRATKAKSYITAMEKNSFANAMQYLVEVDELVEPHNNASGQQIVKAILELASNSPSVISPKAYGVAIHDAGFASGDAAEKAKSSNGSSMHWQSVTYHLGGYSASFLQQLGASVGSIDSDSANNIADAIRLAFIDPDYTQDVQISADGKYITISRHNIFKAAGVDLRSDDDISWGHMRKLFQEAPQLLCDLMPHTYEPLSADGNMVSAVMVDRPAKLIGDYIKSGGTPASYKYQADKVRNHILTDQDSTLLIFGSLDPTYDVLIRDTGAWSAEVSRAADEWADFIYSVSCIDDDMLRSDIINRNFKQTFSSIGQRTRSDLEDIMDEFESRSETEMKSGTAKRRADRIRTNHFYSELERLTGAKDIERAGVDKSFSSSMQEEINRRTDAKNYSFALMEVYYRQYHEVKFGVTDGAIPQYEIENARDILRQKVDDNNKRVYSDDFIEQVLAKASESSSISDLIPKAARAIITADEVNVKSQNKTKNIESFKRKVLAYYNSRAYKRTQGEYLDNENAFSGNLEEWQKKVDASFNWVESSNGRNSYGMTETEAIQWLHDQAEFWNREIINSTLQSAYDTYGAQTASDELSRLTEAKRFVISMVDEARADASIQKTKSVDPRSLTMPHLSYRNKATSPHITAASIELESGGAAIMSGQNAGSYQYLGILDFIQENFSCPVETRTGLDRDTAVSLAEEQGNPLNYVNDDGSVSSVSAHDLLYVWSDERIAATRFAPIKDCLSGGACHIHNPLPAVQTSGTYIGGRYMLADLCWYLSERRVFKAKKKRRVFDKISHIVSTADDLKKTRLSQKADRQTWLGEIYAYQERLANHINQVFKDEQMGDEFGIDDAMMLAQFTTPAIEITYRDANGDFHKETISKWSLSSDEAFAEELDGINVNDIVEARPLAMSVFTVCKKLTYDLREKLSTDPEYSGGRIPSQETLSNYIREACSSWRGKAAQDSEMLSFLKSTPVLRKSSGRSIQFGSSPNAMQNFMEQIGSVQRSGAYSWHNMLNRSTTTSADDRATVKAVNDALEIDQRNFGGSKDVVIVKTTLGKTGQTQAFSQSELVRKYSELNNIDSDFSVGGVYNGILVPTFTDQDSGKASGIWDEARSKGRVILVREDDQAAFINSLKMNSHVYDETIRASLVDGEIKIGGESYVVFDPWQSYSYFDTNMPSTYIYSFNPIELWCSFEDRGLLATGDSGSKVNPFFSKMKMPFDSRMEFNKDILIGNAPVSLKGRSFNLVDLDSKIRLDSDETVRDSLKKEIGIRLSDIGKNEDSLKTNKHIVLPKFDDTYKLADSVMLNRILDYLNRPNDELYGDGTVSRSVNTGDCMNILSVHVDGEVYYIPLIFNTGSQTMVMDSVILDTDALRTGSIAMNWSGKITMKEAEGIKLIFPTIAYKTYTTEMSDEDLANMIECGINITLVDPDTNEQFDFVTALMYSGSTEDGRLIDAGYQTKLENLGNLSKVLPHHYFQDHFMMKDASGRWVVDPSKIQGTNIDPDVIRQMCEWNNIGIWRRFVYDLSMSIHPDPEVNGIMRKVAKACLACDLPPLFAFANLYNGKIRYVNFNHNLVWGCLDDIELERFFYAMNERFCFDGLNEYIDNQVSPYVDENGEQRPAPYINKDGMILGKDGRYHKGHLHFIHPTDDSSMLGVPSGHVKYGLQQILNEGLIEGVKSKGDIDKLINYSTIRMGQGSDYVYGGRLAEDFWKDKSEDDIRRAANRYDRDAVIEDKYLYRTFRLPSQTKRRQRKLQREYNQIMRKRIEFTGEDGSGKADMSEGSPERYIYDSVINRFHSFFDKGMKTPLTDLEIHQLFLQTTASTYNEGRGNYSITVKQFADWGNAVIDRLEHGEFPFESGRSVAGRPMLPYISKSLLNRLLTSSNFRNFDKHGGEYNYETFLKTMLYKLDDTLETLNFSTVGQREAAYTMIDYVGGTYDEVERSRPIGDYGVHLKDLIDNSDPLYDEIATTKTYPGLHEKRERTKQLVKAQQEREARRNYVRVPTYSSETGFMGRLQAKGKGTVWRTLSAVTRTMSTMLPELGPSAVIGRFITQGQNKVYMAIDQNLTRGILSGNIDGIDVKNRAAVKAMAHNPNVQKMWQAMNVLSWSGEDIINLQNAQSWEDFQAILDERINNMTWAEKVQTRMFEWAAGGRVGIPWQIENWVDRLGMSLNPENAPELCEIVGPNKLTRYEQFIEQSPENFMMDMLTTRDDNPYLIEATRARNWIVDREHGGQSIAGLALSHAFENHPFGQFLFLSGLCRFPHYAYNTGGWFANHFAPVSSFVYIARDILIKIANNPNGGKFSDYLNELGIERTQIYNSLREAIINDVLMMGSTATAAMLVGLGAFEPPDDEYYDEYAGNPGEWTIAGFRLDENWWLMDVLGPFGAMAATWKSIQIGKPRFDLLTNWMSQALWSNPIIRTSDIAKTLLDPTEAYLEEYNNVIEQYPNVEGGTPGMLDMLVDDTITYGMNWFGQFITPSILKEISRSKEYQGYERSYKKVENEEGELVDTTYLDARIRKATRYNMVLGGLMDLYNATIGGHMRTGYTAPEMPEVRIPDQNQKDTMQYFSMYHADGSEKSEAEKQALAFEVIATLMSHNDMDALWHDGFVLPIDTRIYVSQMLNDWKQYESDQYNDWVQATGTDAYLIGQGDFAEGRRIVSEVNEAFYNDLRDIDSIFDKLWSEEMNRGLQMYYRLPTTYAQTANGEYYATGYARSISPLQFISPFVVANGTYNAAFGIGTNDEGTMGRSGNWETPSAVVEGASAGGRNLVPINPESITRPKLSDFGNDKNGGYSDTDAGRMYAEAAKSTSSKNNTNSTSSYPRSSGGSGGSGGGGGGGGGRGGSSAPNAYAPSISLPRANAGRIMNTDRLVQPNYDYLRPDFETKGSREAYRRSDI